jgi:hypothetical protein
LPKEILTCTYVEETEAKNHGVITADDILVALGRFLENDTLLQSLMKQARSAIQQSLSKRDVINLSERVPNLVVAPELIRLVVDLISKSFAVEPNLLSSDALIAIAAIIEQTVAETIEIVGYACTDNASTVISPRHVLIGLSRDGSLAKLFHLSCVNFHSGQGDRPAHQVDSDGKQRITLIRQAGVMPYIPHFLSMGYQGLKEESVIRLYKFLDSLENHILHLTEEQDAIAHPLTAQYVGSELDQEAWQRRENGDDYGDDDDDHDGEEEATLRKLVPLPLLTAFAKASSASNLSEIKSYFTKTSCIVTPPSFFSNLST